MKRPIHRSALGLSFLLLSTTGQLAATTAPVPRVLPAACETELALSALPPHLRETAAVYGFGEDGYSLARDGSNGFTCIVNRDDPFSIKPTCFDAAGTATIVPKILLVGGWLLEGRPLDEIRSDLEQRFAQGGLESPERPGLAYMLSHYNRPYDPSRGRLGWFPPHLMFYAPDLTNADIGFSRGAHDFSRSMPFIGYQGPQGYMIVLAENPGERRPLESCPDWVNN